MCGFHVIASSREKIVNNAWHSLASMERTVATRGNALQRAKAESAITRKCEESLYLQGLIDRRHRCKRQGPRFEFLCRKQEE